jgi:hypothetical protein
MVLKFRPGKSEAIIDWFGPQNQRFRREFAMQHNHVLHIRVKNFSIALRVVVSLHTLKRILQNPSVDLDKRVSIAQSYLFSQGCYQASTWPALPLNVFRKIHHAVMEVYRVVLGKAAGDYAELVSFPLLSDDQVVARLAAVAPVNVIRLARLQLLTRIVSKTPGF